MFSSIRGAVRSLTRHPAFVVTASGTLALGIAASVALFSAVNAALLRPLPYPRSVDIYSVRTFFPSGRFTSGLVAMEELGALARMNGVEKAAGVLRVDGAVGDGSLVRQAVSYGATERFFDLFGLPVALGRPFMPGDHLQGAPRVVILSDALWRGTFGARPDIIDSSVTVAGAPARVIGVASPAMNVPDGADLWFNLYLPSTSIGHGLEGFVRLKPGVRPETLRDQMTQAMDALGRKYPDQDVGRAYALKPLIDATVGELRPILLILLSATGLLLLLAAVNVSNLLLVRGTGRTREIAMHAALGASARRIVIQLVCESVLLAVTGGVVGTAAAFAAVKLVMRFSGARLPRLDSVPFDAQVVGVALGVMVLTGIAAGLLPALRLARGDIASLINESGRSVRGSKRTRALLAGFIVAEIAVAVALVAGAGRLVRSFTNILKVDPGFQIGQQVTIDVTLPDLRYQEPVRMAAWRQAVTDRLRAAGAAQVAMTSSLPLQHEWDATAFADLRSQPGTPPDQRPNGRVRFATPAFFSLMGIKLLAGRTFTDADRGEQPVAIVNATFVRRFLRDADPLRDALAGFSNTLDNGKIVRRDAEIVGVVADVKYASLTAAPEPVIYVPPVEFPSLRQSIVIAPQEGRPLAPTDLRSAIRAVDPNVALDFGTVAASVSASISRERLGMLLMSLFGAAAILLAIVGVFGVVAYVVAQRTGEMAVRQALGATRLQLFLMVLGDGGRVAGMGVAIGLVLAWMTGAMMRGYLFEVAASDPIVLVASGIVVCLAAVVALVVPARRAAALDPAAALRNHP
ncbi:MAG TPA: ADOP family duplicated permease [Vicinamibacterales bacterium]